MATERFSPLCAADRSFAAANYASTEGQIWPGGVTQISERRELFVPASRGRDRTVIAKDLRGEVEVVARTDIMPLSASRAPDRGSGRVLADMLTRMMSLNICATCAIRIRDVAVTYACSAEVETVEWYERWRWTSIPLRR